MQVALLVLYLMMAMSYLVALTMTPQKSLSRGLLKFGFVATIIWVGVIALGISHVTPTYVQSIAEVAHVPVIAFHFVFIHYTIAQYQLQLRVSQRTTENPST